MTVKEQAAELIQSSDSATTEMLNHWVEFTIGRSCPKDEMKRIYVAISDGFYKTFDRQLDNGKENLIRSVEAFFYDYNDGLQPKYETPLGLRDALDERMLMVKKMEWLDKQIQQ